MIKKVTFRITGLTPLLQHNPVSMQRPDGGLGTKKIPDPKDEAEKGAYRLENGQLYIKAISFRGSIINKGGGASGRRIGKATAISRCAAAIEIPFENQFCPLFHPKTKKPIRDYKIDSQRAVVQRQGIIRSRPLIEEWMCDWIINLDDDFVTVDQVLELLNISGRVAGAGDYRPQCRGQYGKYKAEIVK